MMLTERRHRHQRKGAPLAASIGSKPHGLAGPIIQPGRTTGVLLAAGDPAAATGGRPHAADRDRAHQRGEAHSKAAKAAGHDEHVLILVLVFVHQDLARHELIGASSRL